MYVELPDWLDGATNSFSCLSAVFSPPPPAFIPSAIAPPFHPPPGPPSFPVLAVTFNSSSCMMCLKKAHKTGGRFIPVWRSSLVAHKEACRSPCVLPPFFSSFFLGRLDRCRGLLSDIYTYASSSLARAAIFQYYSTPTPVAPTIKYYYCAVVWHKVEHGWRGGVFYRDWRAERSPRLA